MKYWFKKSYCPNYRGLQLSLRIKWERSTSDHLTLGCTHWNWSQWAALICGAVRYFYENGFKVWVCGQMKYSLKDSAKQCEGQETNEARRKTATLSNYAFPLSFASSRQHTFMNDPKCNTFGIFEVANQQTVTKTLYLLSKSPSTHQHLPFDQKWNTTSGDKHCEFSHFYKLDVSYAIQHTFSKWS